MSGDLKRPIELRGEYRLFEILLVIEADIATTHLVEQILASLRSRGVRYRKRLLSDLEVTDFSARVLPLVVRSGDPWLAYWLRLWAWAGIPYMYYLDDNFWKIEGDSELARYYRNPIIRRTLEKAVGQAHRVVTNSQVLADFLRQWSRRVEVLPAPFSFELIEDVAPYDGPEIRVGFAGSPSRVKDLEIIAPILNSLLHRNEKVVIEFVGVLPKGVSPGTRVRFFPHCANYEEYIRFQVARGWAVGWAPLFDTEANRSKTNNKYREYAACRIAGIYTDIPPYQESVQHEVSGLLVENSPEAWLAATERLVNDTHLRQSITQLAYQNVRGAHSLPAVGAAWLKALEESYCCVPESRHLRSHTSLAALAWWAQVRMQIGLSYHEGGCSLVLKRSLGRVMRALRDRLGRA